MMPAIFGSYAALIWLVFAKLRLIPLTLPIAIVLAAVGPLFAFYIILSMNNDHPSSTDARVFQRVVQITPHITVPGRVQTVVAQANTPLTKGDVLFTIDPRPFQFEVNRLEAAVAAATQSVPQLKAALDQASAGVQRAGAQLSLAQADFDRQNVLFTKGDIAQAALDKYQRNLESAQEVLTGAKAAETKARLAYESNIGDENTTVAQARQQLDQAKYNLDEATVRAPCDGYVTNLQLLPGTVVSAAASVMPFVCNRDEGNRGVVVATFMQGPYLAIKPGAYAEVVFPMYPGRVFPGKVLTTIDLASEGQLTATGLLPGIDAPHNARFAVRIKLDDGDDLRLPAGTQGSAAVFSGNVQIAGVIRMAVLRANSWLNYLFFTS
ncbi:multidrug resistance efflux pump [Bradyrhizobium barranii subsp. barranii]|nr:MULTISPECIES: HlyD family secretion protein [Bradyrhizobium]MBR0881993.1 HlyD family secretion protein [Bradyrhizobium liaoningense]MBR1000445.1 HlyD family secretion protein [Bradyrhizobium liaoningense]MBR1066959.1 HlyD family secretion protein [Bradyrhizobium liaoningense]MCP1743780.1 multidrug resistance efflux pump [Bradyrhizobium japonicum]MCP1861494.1 multidrug resistance efflux pump [Bradyrhizobium japonicum]